MDRITFLTKLSERGYSRDEAKEAMNQWRAAGRTFDDEAPAPPDSNRPDFGKQLSGSKSPSSFESALMPQASKMNPTSTIGKIGRTVLGIAEAADIGTRAGGTLRTNPETGEKYKVSDPKSAFFRPELEKAKGREESIISELEAKKAALPENDITGRSAIDTQISDIKRGGSVGQFLGEIVSDPLVLAGMGKKALSKVPAVGRKVVGLAKKVVESPNKLLGKLSQELTGVSEEALRLHGAGFGKGAKALKAASGTQMKVADKMLRAIDNIDDYLPEKKVIDKAISSMPKIDISNTIDVLENSKVKDAVSDGAIQANKKIESYIKRLKLVADLENKIPAKRFRDIRIQIDKEAKAAFNKDYKDYIEDLNIKSRNQMMQDLEQAAIETGQPEYVDAMKSYANKMRRIDEIKGYVGQSSQTRQRRIQSFIDNLFGKNSENKQRIVDDIGEIFGEDFLDESKLARLAAELGPEGKATLMPRQTTGRSLLGSGAGGLVGYSAGGIPGAVVGASVSSPKIAAALLEGADYGTRASKFAIKKGAKAATNIPGNIAKRTISSRDYKRTELDAYKRK